ncbi:MAG: prepilin-type N-terminal cleavage/methylation domain-containing protein [Elusimicrobiaceae bacterium]|nr:prepilin-type N-terminal cleavage/methylation domain-containing protein [Elusimicrobiaceae bacterium]
MMYTYARRGFTLIELLVVVLIIGVLTAVALPQFQTAIDKSRYATLMPLAKSVASAQESYYMAAGNYSSDLAYLEVQLPTTPTGSRADIGDGTSVSLSERNNYDYVKISKNNLENSYIIYQDNSANFPGEIHCEAVKGSRRAERLCETLGGQKINGSLKKGYQTYVLEGDGIGEFVPQFVYTWRDADVSQESIDIMVGAMQQLKDIIATREKYKAEHGSYPSLSQLGIPSNLRAGGWAGKDSANPYTYVFSCNGDSCIANAASNNLPMLQFSPDSTYTVRGSCAPYGPDGKNNAIVNNICSSIASSSSYYGGNGTTYYTITNAISELE